MQNLNVGVPPNAERVTTRALGEQPKLRVIDGGQKDVALPLQPALAEDVEKKAIP